MKVIPLISAVIFFTCNMACGQSTSEKNAPRFSLSRTGYTGKSSPDTIFYRDKIIKAIGAVALERSSTKSDLKIGFWTEYYSNGQVKSKGNYQIDSYINCCITDTCKMYSNYKLGQWDYFYPNGQIKASGTYAVKKTRVRTSCSGGDNIFMSYVDASWTYYDDKGRKVKISKEVKEEIENTGH